MECRPEWLRWRLPSHAELKLGLLATSFPLINDVRWGWLMAQG